MPDFSPSEQNFSNFFYLFCLVFSGNAAPAAQNSITKFSRQTEKSKRDFFWRENTRCTFSAGRALASGVSRTISSRYSSLQSKSQTFGGQHLPSRRQLANIFPPLFSSYQSPHIPAVASRFHFYTSRRGHSSIAKCFFAASVFQTQKREVHIFQYPSVRQVSHFRLDRPTPFRLPSLQSITPPATNISPSGASRPTNTSRCHSFHTSPTIPRQPISFLPV